MPSSAGFVQALRFSRSVPFQTPSMAVGLAGAVAEPRASGLSAANAPPAASAVNAIARHDPKGLHHASFLL